MKMKCLSNNRGLTLIELMVTLAIFGMVIMVAYPMLSFTYKTSDAQLKESNQRNEVRTASTYLRNDIEYSRDLTVADSSTLHVVNSKGEPIDYDVETDAEGKSFLVRKGSSAIEFKDIEDIEFQVLNDHLVQAKLITDIADNKFTDFNIYRWDMTIQRPDTKKDIHDIIIDDKVFVLGNQIYIAGSSTVSGADATIISKGSMNLSGSSIQYITTKKIYVDGSVTLDRGAGIGKPDSTSSIYITGNCSVSGTGSLYGNTIIGGNLNLASPKLSGNIYVNGDLNILKGSYSDFLSLPVKIYYTGSLSKPRGFGDISTKAEKVSSIEDIVFPDVSIPPLQPPEWYAERGYTSSTTSKSNIKYYGNSFTFNYNNGNTFNNVIIASKGNITISGNLHVTGILFAPNGQVYVDRGSTFDGLIIAMKTNVTGDSHVTFQAPQIEDLPF